MSVRRFLAEIQAERERQISDEGWTAEHDDDHAAGELALAAACYAAPEPIWVKLEDRRPEDNSLINSNGYRECLNCKRERSRRWAAAKREREAAVCA